MKPRGPFSGISRAGKDTLSFLKAYLLLGTLVVFLIGLLWGDSEYGNLTWFFVIAHVFLGILVLPAAWVANFVAVRVFRWRSWRRQPWRAGVAGVLAVFFMWGGMVLLQPPPSIITTLGRWAVQLYGIGVPVLGSNSGVLLAWVLPPWSPTRVPRRCPDPAIPPSGIPDGQ